MKPDRTTLQEILGRYDTDKNTGHSYGHVYEELLAPIREVATAVLEIGIWTGGSLRAWKEYFPRASIYGIDSDPSRLFAEERIITLQVHQADWDRLRPVVEVLTFDLIIDDGSHLLTDQVMSLFYLWPHLRPNGLYVIEDIQDPQFLLHFTCLTGCQVYDLRAVKGRNDDILVVLKKPGDAR
jgi:trans-aconitate methyltransferase